MNKKIERLRASAAHEAAHTVEPVSGRRRRSVRRLRGGRWLAVLLAVTLGACTKVGPDYVPPQPQMPDAWYQDLTEGLAQGQADLRTWWTSLNDPILDRLIQRATTGNLDVRIAFSRIQQARAGLGIARGDLYPDINGSGFAETSRLSEGITEVPPPPQSRSDEFYGVGLDATWEIDFWGRIARSIESADAGFAATVENYRDVLVVLYAEIANTYTEVRTLQARIRFASGNVTSQRGTLRVARDRVRAQLAPELDVRQAQLNVASTEAFVPRLQANLTRAMNRLGVLLGQRPSALHAELAPELPVPPPPDRVLVGMPADLLRQRPDIRGAERALAAQTARVGVATADLYPAFSLSGTFAFETTTSSFLEFDDRAYSFGPSFRWNIFDGGRVRNRIRLEDARTAEALIVYERTVLDALEEVESAFAAYVQERRRLAALQRAVTAARAAARLVRQLYVSGLTNFQNVFDTESQVFVQEDALAESQGALIRNLVRVYRALGGGWQPDPQQLQQEVQDAEENGEPIM